MLLRTAKSCGPDAPTLVSSSRSCVGPTGLRQNLSADDGGKRARSPGRARHKPLKPLRAGMPGDSGVLVVTRVRSTDTKCTRGRGCSGHPAFPTPSMGAKDKCKPRAHRAARFERMSRGRHCERSEAIYTFFAARWIASSLTLLAMTVTTQIHSSCPDLIRASIHLRKKVVSKKMDHRVKPGDDDFMVPANASLPCSLCIRTPASLSCAP